MGGSVFHSRCAASSSCSGICDGIVYQVKPLHRSAWARLDRIGSSIDALRLQVILAEYGTWNNQRSLASMGHAAFYFGLILNETERLMRDPGAPGMNGIGEQYDALVSEHNLLKSHLPALGGASPAAPGTEGIDQHRLGPPACAGTS